MHFHPEVNSYLTGARFSNGIQIVMDGDNSTACDRLEFVSALATGHTVLHIGFADHLELIPTKIKMKTWLHEILVQNSTLCLGVDRNNEAVKFCRDQLGFEHVYCHDVINDKPLEAITRSHWHYAILGEVLEHLSNPVSFLSSLREKYGDYIDNFVITVPNAWDLINLYSLCRRIEYINSDHRFWFTPYTLAKVAADAGLAVQEFHFVGSPLKNRLIARQLTKRFPMLRETLIGVFQAA